jgi:hypothetical protein
MEPTDTFCGQSAVLFVVKVGGTYSYHWALKVPILSCSALNDAFQTLTIWQFVILCLSFD